LCFRHCHLQNADADTDDDFEGEWIKESVTPLFQMPFK
jgi:hypothetical protein